MANVRWTKVERIAIGVYLDRIEELTPEQFHANDVTLARRDELLDQCRMIDPEIEFVVVGCLEDRLRGIEADDTGTGPSDVGFQDDRETKPLDGLGNLTRVIERSGPWVSEPKVFKKGQLASFARFDGESFQAVDDRHAQTFKMM